MKTPEEKIVIDYVVSGRFKKDLEQDKKHINRTIAETIASENTGKNLADKIEYYLNTIDELEREVNAVQPAVHSASRFHKKGE
jgi:ribosomal protein S6E (S10)